MATIAFAPHLARNHDDEVDGVCGVHAGVVPFSDLDHAEKPLATSAIPGVEVEIGSAASAQN